MPRKWYRKKQFIALRRQWTKKLDQEGFKDIEDGEDSPPYTRPDTAHLQYLLGAGVDEHAEDRRLAAEAVTRYYQLASIFRENYEFRRVVDREIWALHTDGLSVPEITKRVRRNKCKVAKQYVDATINKLRKVMLGYEFGLLSEWSGDACKQLDNYDPDKSVSGAEDGTESEDSGSATGRDHEADGQALDETE